MSSQLKEKDLQLLDASTPIRVGQKPYEDGLWSTQGSKDFVHFQLYDDNNNLIEFRSLPLTEFIVNNNICLSENLLKDLIVYSTISKYFSVEWVTKAQLSLFTIYL